MFKTKQTNNILEISSLKNKKINLNRDFPTSTKTWYNSAYNFNKNLTKNIPFLDVLVNKIIKIYFNLTANVNLNSKFRRRRTKIRRYSGNKVFVSKAEIKHSNEKVLITIYTYNRTKKHIYKTLFSIYNKLYRNISNKNLYTYIKFLLKNNKYDNKYIDLLKSKYIEWKLSNKNENKYKKYKKLTDFLLKKNIRNNKKILAFRRLLKRNKKLFYLKKFYLIKYLNKLFLNNYLQKSRFTNLNIYNKLKTINYKSHNLLIRYMNKFKSISNILKENNLTFILYNMKKNSNMLNKSISNIYLDKLQNDFFKETLYKETLYMKYNQISLVEDYKFTNIYLNKLNYILSKIYNKKIEFNIVNLKYIHLDSTILSNSMISKLRNRRNSPMRIVKKALRLADISEKVSYRFDIKNKFIRKYNSITEDSVNYKFIGYDRLNLVLSKLFNNENEIYINSKFEFKNKYLYRSIKLRKIRGIRMEIKGRLKKRLVAARSMYKYRYKGSLQNLDNVIGLSSVLLKGYQKSNIDYINVNSKTRNGSFGLKGWISSK